MQVEIKELSEKVIYGQAHEVTLDQDLSGLWMGFLSEFTTDGQTYGFSTLPDKDGRLTYVLGRDQDRAGLGSFVLPAASYTCFSLKGPAF